MARFDFGKRTHDDEGIPPEPVEGDTGDGLVPEPGDGGSRRRRPLILAVIGIACAVLGGLYLANSLFFSAPPPPPTPTRQALPTTPGATPQVPGVPSPTKEAAPVPTPPPPSSEKQEAKPAPQTTPSDAAKAQAPVKAAPPVKASAEPPSKPAAQAKTSKEPAASVAKGETKAASKAPVASAKGFSIQVGAMAQEANAEKLKQKLSAMGYQAVVRKGTGFANNHVVTVGDPTDKREAEEMARRLNVDGFPSKLVVVAGKYTPEIGSFLVLDEALDLARELQKKNYRPKITSKPATTVLFQVRHGQFDTRAAAVKRGEELKAKGVTAWVVPN